MRDKMETLGWVTAFVGMIGLLVFSPVLTFKYFKSTQTNKNERR